MVPIKSLLPLIVLLFVAGCQSKSQPYKKVREAAYAGKFYTGDKKELNRQLAYFFSKAKPKKAGITRAVISPHAGYVFSGQVAASAFNQVDANRDIKNVFLLGSAHRVRVSQASVFAGKAYKTPLGKVEINQKIVSELLENKQFFKFNQSAHEQEHSLEVQLPFLQHHLKKPFRIVPILINTRSHQELKAIANTLGEYYTESNLFVVSTDFSHYPKHKDACKVDSLTAQAVASGNPSELYAQIQANSKKNMKNLHTSMCGLSAVMVMLNLVEENNHVVEKIEYMNSSDSPHGEKNRVVGYWAMRVAESASSQNSSKENDFQLTNTEKQKLLDIARKTINYYLKNNKLPPLDEDLSETLQVKTGCFVTLHKNGRLRGCIGNFGGQMPLAEGVQEMAVAAATEDRRFSKVQPEEMDNIEIEISVLTPLKKIESLDEFELGRHGIYIKKGMRTGTYLPQVADARDWTKEEFVSHCAQNKAGIGAEGWKNAELYTYEAIIFSEK